MLLILLITRHVLQANKNIKKEKKKKEILEQISMTVNEF